MTDNPSLLPAPVGRPKRSRCVAWTPTRPIRSADPRVCALALELAGSGYSSTAVTVDHLDRLPIKLSLATACSRLKIESRLQEVFLRDVGITS
jgi:hypothetical protein